MIGRSAALLVILGVPFLMAGRLQDPAKTPLPTATELAESEKLVKDLFKDEYAKRAPADRLSLAKRMLSQGIQSKDDPKSQFVLLREARDLALQGGDLQLAFSAVDELARIFAVDAVGMRSTLLVTASKSAKTPDDFKSLTLVSLKLIEPLLAADDYDGAEKLAATAVAQAKKSQDVALTNRVTLKSKEVSDLKTQYGKLKKAKEALVADPGEPAANLTLGRFQCLVKGNWVGGIPYLAKGSDPGMRTLAERELLNPATPSEQQSLGDAWWDLAEKEPAPGKDRLKEHAASWYTKCLLKLTGITRTKIEKRLSELGAQKLAKGTWIDATDPKSFGQQGKTGDPIEITTKPGFYQWYRMNQFPKGEFDAVSVHFTLDSTKPGMGWIQYEPKALAAFVDTTRGIFAHASDNGTNWIHDFAIPWSKKDDSTIAIVVGDGEYVIYLDSREMGRIKTLNTRIDKLQLEARDGVVKFDKIQFRKAE